MDAMIRATLDGLRDAVQEVHRQGALVCEHDGPVPPDGRVESLQHRGGGGGGGCYVRKDVVLLPSAPTMTGTQKQ